MTSGVKTVIKIRDEFQAKLGLDVKTLNSQVKAWAEASLSKMFGGDFHAGRMLKAAAERAAGHFSQQELMRSLVESISQKISTANHFQGRNQNANITRPRFDF